MKYLGILVGRAVYRRTVDGQTEELPFNDPTALATAALSAISPCSGHMLDSFSEAGGVEAVSLLLCDTTCPVTLMNCVDIMTKLLNDASSPEGPDRRQEIADKSYEKGEKGWTTPQSGCD